MQHMAHREVLLKAQQMAQLTVRQAALLKAQLAAQLTERRQMMQGMAPTMELPKLQPMDRPAAWHMMPLMAQLTERRQMVRRTALQLLRLDKRSSLRRW